MQFKELTGRLKCLRSTVFGMRLPSSWLHRSCDSLGRSVFLCTGFCQPFSSPPPPPKALLVFLHWCFQGDRCLFLSFHVGAHGWVTLLCQSWGYYRISSPISRAIFSVFDPKFWETFHEERGSAWSRGFYILKIYSCWITLSPPPGW